MADPPLVRPVAPEVATALGAGAVVALPAAGGYCLAVRAGMPGDDEQLVELGRALRRALGREHGTAVEDADRLRYLVGDAGAVRALADEVGDELATLLSRCWPGPVEVAVRRHGATVIVGQPDGRPLRKLCRELGPWRAATLPFTEAAEVRAACAACAASTEADVASVACVVDGGRRPGAPPTVVDATATPLRIAQEGALPAAYIEATMLMSERRRWLRGRRRRP